MYRTIAQYIKDDLGNRQVLILLGPRQVGKTTLLKNLLSDEAIYIDLDDKIYRDFFDSLSAVKYSSYIDSQLGAFNSSSRSIILILDEAQRLKDPGLTAKIFYDEIPSVKLIITGSSTLDIKKKTSESLAGRKTTLHLYPLSFQEYCLQNESIHKEMISDSLLQPNLKIDELTGRLLLDNALERMRVGIYPGVLSNNAENYLHELVDAIILKDIFYMNLVKNPNAILDLLVYTAKHINEPFVISDASKYLGIARQTILDYLNILEKSYIIFSVKPFSGKRSDEISKYNKLYFYDLGIRNALINDFRPVDIREDYEAIFTNFLITEIKKLNSYYMSRFQLFYWKTSQGSEVDLVGSKDNQLIAISCSPSKEKYSRGFENTYPETKQISITAENLLNFIL